ncbi:MAG: type I methionyl aminopeptidase [Patescibacteria group bacterium]|nr:type I methionyl aminopeptidase [Patescibacteria group bacterium]
MIRLKSENDLKFLRISGKILSEILKKIEKEIKEGAKLSYLDKLARELSEKAGAKPAFSGYYPEGASKPYSAAICASINEVVVHGIPNNYVIQNGDLVKIDFGINYQGYFTDAAITVGAGDISKDAKRLINITKKSLKEAIKTCKPGKYLGDIGFAIENAVKKEKFHIIQSLTGHGVGFELHEDPTIYNYGKKGDGMELKPGLVLAIEPMVSIGSSQIVQRNDDSFMTADGSLSAHFEHTVAITDGGCEVLTKFS